jgi:nicotinamidase-related amidase
MNPALLVIDVQEGFNDAAHWGERNNPACEDNIAALIAHWRERRWPLVYVRHDSTEADSPLRPGQPGTAFKDMVTGTPDVLVTKGTNSCFYGEPDLHEWLSSRAITALVLCGITTNHCCETTARMAGNLGYAVRFVLDATHTFPRGDMSADDLARATATNLSGEFASVVATADVVAD